MIIRFIIKSNWIYYFVCLSFEFATKPMALSGFLLWGYLTITQSLQQQYHKSVEAINKMSIFQFLHFYFQVFNFSSQQVDDLNFQWSKSQEFWCNLSII